MGKLYNRDRGQLPRGTVPALAVFVLAVPAGAWLVTAGRHPAVPLLAAMLAVAATAVLGRWIHLHPHPVFGRANRVTLVRAALVCILVGAAAGGHAAIASWTLTALALTALVLDGVDGALARRDRTDSAFGARFDQETDALLIVVLSLWCVAGGITGAWVLIGAAWRYLFLAAGAALPWLRRDLVPSRRRQGACVLLVFALIVAVCPLTTPLAAQLSAALGVTAVSASFMVDIGALYLGKNEPEVCNETTACWINDAGDAGPGPVDGRIRRTAGV